MAKLTISQVLETSNKKMAADAKVAAIVEIVTATRKAYGNSDIEIKPSNVNSCNGGTQIQYLSNKDKVALVAGEVAKIRTAAIEATESNSGVLFNAEVTKLVAINPILVNLAASVESTVI